MDLREMLLGIFSQMMDTCDGENRMQISCPYSEKLIVQLRCTNQFSTIFGTCLHHGVLHAVACQMHIVQSQTLVTHTTVNARVTSIPNCAN